MRRWFEIDSAERRKAPADGQSGQMLGNSARNPGIPIRNPVVCDTGTAAGKAFLDMLGVFAEFEANLRRERQLEGIGADKARGVYKGRKPAIDAVEVLRLRYEEKLGPAAIACRLGIGRASVYRCWAGRVRSRQMGVSMPIKPEGDQPAGAVRARRRPVLIGKSLNIKLRN